PDIGKSSIRMIISLQRCPLRSYCKNLTKRFKHGSKSESRVVGCMPMQLSLGYTMAKVSHRRSTGARQNNGVQLSRRPSTLPNIGKSSIRMIISLQRCPLRSYCKNLTKRFKHGSKSESRVVGCMPMQLSLGYTMAKVSHRRSTGARQNNGVQLSRRPSTMP